MDSIYRDGIAAFEAARYAEAAERFGEAVAADEGNPEYRYALGNALAASARYGEAVDAFRRVIEMAPEMIDAHANLGAALQLDRRLDDAVAVYRRVIELAPGSAQLHFNLGTALKAADRLAESVDSYRAATALDPNWAEAQAKLGGTLSELGQHAEAITYLQRAIEIEPEPPEHHVGLAEAWLARGEISVGLAVCDTYLGQRAYSAGVMALKLILLRELGQNAAADELADFERFVRPMEIDPPAGFADRAAFHAALEAEARSSPTLEIDPPQLATRSGAQTAEMFIDPMPAVAALIDCIDAAVREYIRGLADDATHPFVANAPTNWRLTGWAVILERQGYQMSHIHPSGWLSGVYYLSVPVRVRDSGEAKEGWIEFGRAPDEYSATARQSVHAVEPTMGRMVLFPSYLYHRTIPFGSDETRISYAFDVMAEL